MSKKASVHFFSFILAAWLVTFTIVSVSCQYEAISEKASITTKLHSSNSGYLASEPCEEKEVRDAANEFQSVLIFTSLYAKFGTVNPSLNICLRLYSVSSFANTTNLPLYLAKKSFLI